MPATDYPEELMPDSMTPAAPGLPEAAYRVTSHELLALLSFDRSAGTALTRRVLGLADLPEDHDLVRAGIGTLNIRDAVEIRGEQVTLLAQAQVLARILATSSQWFDITRIGPDSVSPSYVVDSPVGRAAILLRPLSEYVCIPLRDDVDLFDFVESTVDEAAASMAGAAEGIVTSRRYRGTADPIVANLKAQKSGSFQLAAPPLDDQGQLSVRDLATSERPGRVVRETLAVTQ